MSEGCNDLLRIYIALLQSLQQLDRATPRDILLLGRQLVPHASGSLALEGGLGQAADSPFRWEVGGELLLLLCGRLLVGHLLWYVLRRRELGMPVLSCLQSDDL